VAIPSAKFTDVLALIAYHGTRYVGYQSQQRSLPLAGALHTSIQDVLLAGLVSSFSLDPPPSLLSLSRTDAGVHARELLVRTTLPLPPLGLTEAGVAGAWNAALPPDVRCVRARLAQPSQVKMKFAARGKAYSYYFRTGGDYGAGEHFADFSMFSRHLADERALARLSGALALFQGAHDFGAFSMGRKEKGGSEVRTVEEARVTVLRPEEYDTGLAAGPPPAGAGRAVEPPERGGGRGGGGGGGDDGALRIVRLRFVGNGFLRRQVRLMVGAALAVATGRLPLEALRAQLAGGGAAARAAGGVAASGGNRGYMAASVRGLWLEQTLLHPDFWADPHWCNNRDARYLEDRGIPRSSWHPERVCLHTGWRTVPGAGESVEEGGGVGEEEEEESGEEED
jgi:tRNA pseudouridine38-40 synthase